MIWAIWPENHLCNVFKLIQKRAAHSVKCPSLNFGSGLDLRLMGLSPASGSILSTDYTYSSPSPTTPSPALLLFLSLSKIHKLTNSSF